jgi:uncharacterized membrane protein
VSQFEIYFAEGREHILNYRFGYDHILFIVALCALYHPRDWKKILILVTAFTVGHSLTLGLSALDIIPVDEKLVEFLIPVTIFVTAVFNLFKNEDSIAKSNVQINYVFAALFGLIHGMGFSTYFKAILGNDRSIITQLFAFNLGLEVGQIIIVVIFLTISFLSVDLVGVDRRDWKLVISSGIAGMALVLMRNTAYWIE